MRSEEILALDTDAAILVSSRSSASWKRHRWSEINVFYFEEPPARDIRWVTEVLGCSGVPGERTKRQRLASSHLERALKLIDESDMGIAVREEAREWAENRGIVGRNIIGQKVPDTDPEAGWWLFGADNGAQPDDVERMLGISYEDYCAGITRSRFGSGEIMIPFRALLPFVDREAFRSAMEARRG